MKVGSVVRIINMFDKNDNCVLAIVEKIYDDRAVLRYCYCDELGEHNGHSENIRTRLVEYLRVVKE